jgi:Uma2 family endonuclease
MENQITLVEPTPDEVELPPTEDELPYDDGIPMESLRHALQMDMLINPLRLLWKQRQDIFVGANMFVYFWLAQLRKKNFRGADVFVVLDVPKRERKSWVVWQEGKGPDVVIELLSDSTAERDKGEKKLIYQNQLRVPEYFWFDPFSGELAGLALREGVYEPIETDEQNRLISRQLQLTLVLWEGTHEDVSARWLRWATPEGALLPTPQEWAEQAQQRAAEMEALLARYREHFGELPE